MINLALPAAHLHPYHMLGPKVILGDDIQMWFPIQSVSEIKVLFCAPTGCTPPKTVHPGISPCTLLICTVVI